MPIPWNIPSTGSLSLKKTDTYCKGLKALFEYALEVDVIHLTQPQAAGSNGIKGKAQTWGSNETEVLFRYNPTTYYVTEITLSKSIQSFGTFDLPEGVSITDWNRHIEVKVFNDGNSVLGSTQGVVTGILHLGERISVPFRIENPSNSSRFRIDAAFESTVGGKHEGLGLGDLVAVLQDKPSSNQDLALLPSSMLQSVQRAIQLQELHLTIDVKNSPHLVSAAVRFRLMEGESWAIIPNVFSVGNLWVDLDIEYPLEADFRFPIFTVGGTLHLGNQPNEGNVDLTARWPDLSIQGRLRDGEEIKVGQMMLKMGLSVPPAFQDLAIDQLSFAAEPTTNPKSFYFTVGVKDVLKTGKFDIESLSLSVDYRGSKTAEMPSITNNSATPASATEPAQLNATFIGRFQLLGIQFYVSTERRSEGEKSSWNFVGQADGSSTSIGKMIGEFTDASDLPNWLNGLIINQIQLQYNTQSKDFSFSCDVDAKGLFDNGSNIELVINIEIKRSNPDVAEGTPATYEKTLSGRLILSSSSGLKMEFDVLFDLRPSVSGTTTTFMASYRNLSGGAIDIGELTKKLNLDPNISLTVNLQDAFIIYDKAAGASAFNSMFGLDVGGGINLSQLPLVGKYMSPESSLKVNFQPTIAKQLFAADETNRLQGLIAPNNISLPPSPINPGLTTILNLQISGKTLALPLSVPSADVNASQLNTGTTPNVAPTNQSMPASQVKWQPIQQSFGPVNFDRVGFLYQNKIFWLLLDGSFSMGGLSIALYGLSAGSSLKKFEPHFRLDGLGIDFKRGTLEIGAAFARNMSPPADVDFEFDGTATLQIEDFKLSALGSYAKMKTGESSLFIYATLDYVLGGPVFFVVTGLAGGFGYNRKLQVPSIEQIPNFPLIQQVLGTSVAPPATSNESPSKAELVQRELNQITPYLPPKVGEYFLAVGLRFSSFEQIDSFALLSMAFGREFEMDLLGLSTLKVPSPGPEAPPNSVEPLAELQMALKVSFLPAEGFLGIRAQLTSNSFILSRKCRLTGGFAFYAWYKGEHDGDFVITLGGYHRMFKPPAHYPKVPRLGFNWQVSEQLSLTGDAYFALTPHAFMAGGHLQALWQDGSLSAWFKAGADFLISWKPYHYDAEIGVDVGAKWHSFSVDLGADLHIWGPDFGGKAHVKWFIFSFTVHFGDSNPKPTALTWEQFHASFLPKGDKLSLRIAAGQVKQNEQPDNSTSIKDLGVVNPKDLQLNLDTFIPITTVAGVLLKAAESVAAPSFAIGSMNVKTGAVTSTLTVKNIKRDNAALDPLTNTHFVYTPRYKKAPVALWGEFDEKTLKPPLNGEKYIEKALMGLGLEPAEKLKSFKTHPVPKANLQYETVSLGKVFALPVNLAVAQPAVSPVPIQDSIKSTAVLEAQRGHQKVLELTPATHPPGAYLVNQMLATPMITAEL